MHTHTFTHALKYARTRTNLPGVRCALDMATKHFYKMIVAAGKRSSEDIGPKEEEEEETNA